MKKTVLALSLIFALLFSAAIGVNLTTAGLFERQSLPELTIKSDGSITGPEFINRTGNTYTLTANIEGYAFVIECSNIVFDGAGHTINAPDEYINAGLELKNVANVRAKNLEVSGSAYIGISLYYCSNCLLTGVKTDKWVRIIGDFNTIAESNGAISIFTGSNNFITRNNITEIFVGDNCFNSFSQNNILFNYVPDTYFSSTNYWDNGSVGNYWSDYLIKYPNASEIGNTGIGDTPYVIDADNVDNYPFMYPYDIEKDTIAFPTPEPQPEPEPFPTTLVATASAALVAIIGVGLLVYLKKRNR
jgi:parallel beta-helix repeat protein